MGNDVAAENNENGSALVQIASAFAEEFGRVKQAQQQASELSPPPALLKYLLVDPKLDLTQELGEQEIGAYENKLMAMYRAACHELDMPEILPAALRSIYEQLFRGEVQSISDEFPPGKRTCLAILPFTDGGLPLGKPEQRQFKYFYKLGILAGNLTEGFGSDLGHYFDLLPRNIQEACSFQVPYTSGTVPTNEEIQTLQTLFFEKFTNLKRLVDKV